MRRAVLALLLLPLSAPVRAEGDAGRIFDCGGDEGKDVFKSFLIKLKKDSPQDFKRLRNEKPPLETDKADPRRCLLAQWCLLQSGKISFGKSLKALSAPARACEAPLVPGCESATECVFETAPLAGKDGYVARVVKEGETVTLAGKPPVYEDSSGNDGDFTGLAFAVKDKAFKVQPHSGIVFLRENAGGKLTDTSATMPPWVEAYVCKFSNKDCIMVHEKPCATHGFTKAADGSHRWVDARGGRYRNTHGISCEPEKPSDGPQRPRDRTRELIP